MCGTGGVGDSVGEGIRIDREKAKKRKREKVAPGPSGHLLSFSLSRSAPASPWPRRRRRWRRRCRSCLGRRLRPRRRRLLRWRWRRLAGRFAIHRTRLWLRLLLARLRRVIRLWLAEHGRTPRRRRGRYRLSCRRRRLIGRHRILARPGPCPRSGARCRRRVGAPCRRWRRWRRAVRGRTISPGVIGRPRRAAHARD